MKDVTGPAVYTAIFNHGPITHDDLQATPKNGGFDALSNRLQFALNALIRVGKVVDVDGWYIVPPNVPTILKVDDETKEHLKSLAFEMGELRLELAERRAIARRELTKRTTDNRCDCLGVIEESVCQSCGEIHDTGKASPIAAPWEQDDENDARLPSTARTTTLS